MWTRFSGEIIIPLHTAKGFIAPNMTRLLPVKPMGSRAYMILQQESRVKIDCSLMHVISPCQIEPICTFCENVIQCVMDSKKTRKLKLLHGLKIIWQEADLLKVSNTCEVPFLSVLPFSQWNVLDYRKEFKFSFSIDRIKNNLKKLIDADFAEVIQRSDICWYIQRKHFGGIELRDQFISRLNTLASMLEKYKSSIEFEQEMKNLIL
jgi:hypothetical protein